MPVSFCLSVTDHKHFLNLFFLWNTEYLSKILLNLILTDQTELIKLTMILLVIIKTYIPSWLEKYWIQFEFPF